MIDISESVELEITGRLVSIAVAPAGAIASYFPIYLAIKGIVISAMISLTTFDKNARVDISVEWLDNIIDDRVYHPSPDPTALAYFIGIRKMTPAKMPPIKLPAIIAKGIKRI